MAKGKEIIREIHAVRRWEPVVVITRGKDP